MSFARVWIPIAWTMVLPVAPAPKLWNGGPMAAASATSMVNVSSMSYVLVVGGFEMNAMLTVYFSVGASFAGLGLLKLQARLERWSYQRHAED